MAGEQLLPWIDSGDAEGNRNSMQNFAGNGVTTSWDFNFAGGYISAADVKAYIYHSASGLTDAINPVVLTGPNTLQVIPAVPTGDFLVVYRDTPKDTPLVDYTTGAVLDEANLDKSNKQAVFVAAEMSDRFDAINASSADAITRSFEALSTANAAIADSAAAVATANATNATAAAAQAAAAAAVATANGASDVANGIAGTADAAFAAASTAVATANAAEATANGIAGTANSALTQANAAVTTANAASTSAANAVATANAASAAVGGKMDKSANLSDVVSASAARGNIGAGSAGGFTLRNLLINGNFELWSRGTSSTISASSVFRADRWRNSAMGSTSVQSLQSFPVGDTSLGAYASRYIRVQATQAAGNSNFVNLGQRIADVRRTAGRTCVLTFWARADAARPLAVEFTQHFGSGGSPSTEVTGLGVQKITLSTTWTKYTVPVTFPSIAGKTLGSDGDSTIVIFWFDAGSDYNARTGTLGHQSGTFYIAQCQLEYGDKPTEFELVPNNVLYDQCQDYYRVIPSFQFAGTSIGGGNCTVQAIYLGRPMRATPTVNISGVTSVPGGMGITVGNIYPHTVQFFLTGVPANSQVWLTADISLDAEISG
ncbi:putative tail fiber protein [Ralstonia phage RsoP1IDN]|uniref:Putative tail fiber protein n=1 Tax=Ralstonia phage RsoP1IDN TaxID=2060091 RepID=A0A2P0VPG9_9CAUD|nr:tail fiber protein [Ralstonia phage RsoP1IDN]AUG85435.1 putative tail fiber protein [Ralstonia phage RsoP1IDN]